MSSWPSDALKLAQTYRADVVVLDASALLALINGEAGAERVAQSLSGACISSVNLSEVAGKLVDRRLAIDEIHDHLAALGLEVVPFTMGAALAAAALREVLPRTLSLGDRACIGLGMSRGLEVLTADASWSSLALRGLRVVAVR
ncbi:MAG: type II toxin-antitoxin system VapC family toxin [Candidatus Dormibacteria bacterium]